MNDDPDIFTPFHLFAALTLLVLTIVLLAAGIIS